MRASSTAIPVNTVPRPTCDATAPIAGPSTIPISAAPTAPPRTDARRPAGAVLVSHESAAAHETAPPTPWMRRERSNNTGAELQAKPTVATISSPRPMTAVVRTPRAFTSAIDGTAASRIPAGYAATRIPTSVVVMCVSRTRSGTSGGTTA